MIVIILPIFNEENSIESMISNLFKILEESKLNYKIIVCNDGSTDGTLKILEKFTKNKSFEIINHKLNRGLGRTVRDLFERSAEITSMGDFILRMDADDTHNPKFIFDILKKLQEGHDVVTVSRFAKGGSQRGVSLYRAFISRCANLLMKFFFPIANIRDYSCGYRGYKAEKIQEAIKFYGSDFIQLRGLGFTCTLEKLIKLKLIGSKFAEIPFVLRYDNKKSKSKMVTSITTLGYIVMILLYYWPFGGWRSTITKKYKVWKK